MRRRSFLATLPVLISSGAVQGSSNLSAESDLSFNARRRMAQPAIWSDGPAPAMAVLDHVGRHGSRILSLRPLVPADVPASASFGLSIRSLPGFTRGVALWRYAPWKAWTKPMSMRHPADLPGDDVQFAYWQYEDGAYGVALPLGGGGFRSTLGARDGGLVTVCRALAPARQERDMPQVAL